MLNKIKNTSVRGKLYNIKTNGFLLIEIIIVLSLLLIIMTIAVPSLKFLNQQVIVSDLERLNLAFLYMQQSAISSNKTLRLKFNDQKTYSYENFTDSLSSDIEFGVIPGTKGPPSTPTHLINNPISFVKNNVIFYNNGQIQPGTAYLTNKNKDYLVALTIPISQVSFIRKYKHQSGKWILI